jgi:hypothetical protein
MLLYWLQVNMPSVADAVPSITIAVKKYNRWTKVRCDAGQSCSCVWHQLTAVEVLFK